MPSCTRVALQFEVGDAVLPLLIAYGDCHGDAVLLCHDLDGKPRPGPQFAVLCCGVVAFMHFTPSPAGLFALWC